MKMKRRTTKIFSVRLGKRLPVALMTMALAAANMAFAQEENPWVGEALPTASGEFYLVTLKLVSMADTCRVSFRSATCTPKSSKW